MPVVGRFRTIGALYGVSQQLLCRSVNLRVILEGFNLGAAERDQYLPLTDYGPQFIGDFAPITPPSLAALLNVLHFNLHSQCTPQCIARCISGEAETLTIVGF